MKPYNIDMNASGGSIRFDRNELAGAFGDIGTDLPLIVGMILASGLHSASVLVMFGVMQYFTALRYGMPIPVQPLKAVAVIVITQKIAPGVLYGGGLAIGIAMLLLTVTGGITWLARVVPKAVVRGLQLGLGIQLAMLALKDADYGWVTEQVKSVADRSAHGRIVSMLEGGYALSALGRSVVQHLRVLAGLNG